MLSNWSCSDAARQPGTGGCGRCTTSECPAAPGLPQQHLQCEGQRTRQGLSSHPAPSPGQSPLTAATPVSAGSCPAQEHCHRRRAPQGGQSPSPLQTLQGTCILLFYAMLPPHPDTPDTQQEHLAPSLLPPVTPEQLWALYPDPLRSKTRETPAHPPLLPFALPHFHISAWRGCLAGAAHSTQPPGRGQQHLAPWDTVTDHLNPAGNCPALAGPWGPSYGKVRPSPSPESTGTDGNRNPHCGLSDHVTGPVGKGSEKPTLVSPRAASS